MKVGITYDLKDEYMALGFSDEETAEFDRGETIDAIDSTLRELGFETERIGHIRSLAARLVTGERWDIVFNIAEGLNGYGREAQVPGLLDAYGIPYTFSDPMVLGLTLHKGITKRIIRDLGVPTPDFCVVEKAADIEQIRLPFPLFAKPVAEGTSRGINGESKISNPDQLHAVCRSLLATYQQPVLVETFLPGREFTVGILGTGAGARSIGVTEVFLNPAAEQAGYSYLNKEHYETLVEYRKVDDESARRAEAHALTVFKGLGCRDAGRVDLRVGSDGVPQVMEINPLAGLHPVRSDLCIIARQSKMTYADLLAGIMSSAMERVMQNRERFMPFEIQDVDRNRLQSAGSR